MAIRLNELRIGNIIGWRTGFGELITGSVYEVHEDKVAIGPEGVIDANSSGQGFMKIGGIEPVPLTPEWLERMGFKKEWYDSDIGVMHSQTIAAQRAGIKPYRYYNWGNGKITMDDNFYCKGVSLKYVHQLQNLYFALCGEELEIKDL